MGDNKEIRKLTKTPAWKVVKNLEANLKFQELYLEEILKVIAQAKVSFSYPIEFDKVEQDITNALWNFDKLRNGNKKDSGRQALRERAQKDYSEIRLSIERIQEESGFNLDNSDTWK